MNILVDNVELQKSLRRLQRYPEFKTLNLTANRDKQRIIAKVSNGTLEIQETLVGAVLEEGETTIVLKDLVTYVDKSNYADGLTILTGSFGVAVKSDKYGVQPLTEAPWKIRYFVEPQHVAVIEGKELHEILTPLTWSSTSFFKRCTLHFHRIASRYHTFLDVCIGKGVEVRYTLSGEPGIRPLRVSLVWKDLEKMLPFLKRPGHWFIQFDVNQLIFWTNLSNSRSLVFVYDVKILKSGVR